VTLSKQSKHIIWLLASPAVVVIVLAILLIIAALVQHIAGSTMIRKAEAELADEGIPVTWEELERVLPGTDADRTGRAAMQAALEEVASLPSPMPEERAVLPIEGDANLPPGTDPVPDEMLAAIERRVAQGGDATDAVREALQGEVFWFIVPTNMLAPVHMEYASAVRRAARLFSLGAVLGAVKDDPDAAADNVAACLRMADMMATDPLILGGLVRIACEGVGIQALETVMARTDLSGAQLNRLAAEVSDVPMDLRPSIMGELVYVREMYALLHANGSRPVEGMMDMEEAPLLERFLATNPLGAGWVRVNEALHLRLFQDLIEMWPLPWEEFMARHQAAVEEIPKVYVLAGTSGTAFKAFRSRELRSQGIRDAALAGIAIRKYVDAKGEFPENLDVLVPGHLEAVPRDPVSREPMNYHVSGNRAHVSFKLPEKNDVFRFNVYKSPGRSPDQ